VTGIITSRAAMALAVTAAAAFVINAILACIAYAVLSNPFSFGTSEDLIRAAAWMTLVAALAALTGVSWAAWSTVVRARWGELWEVVVGAIGILLIVVGELVQALRVTRTPESARVLLAVGLGIWAVLAMIHAGRRSLAEQGAHGVPLQAPIWAAASAGLLVTAVGWGLPPASVFDSGLAIADGVVPMVGVAILAVAVLVAQYHGFLARRYPSLVAGLFLVAAAYGASAVVGGVVYGFPLSVTGLRIGLPIEFFMIAVAVALLGASAWERVQDLTVVHAAPGYWGSGSPHPAGTAWAGTPRAGAAWRGGQLAHYCIQCGLAVPPGAHFCPACGAPVSVPTR
jgi:hypothetical protein